MFGWLMVAAQVTVFATVTSPVDHPFGGAVDDATVFSRDDGGGGAAAFLPDQGLAAYLGSDTVPSDIDAIAWVPPAWQSPGVSAWSAPTPYVFAFSLTANTAVDPIWAPWAANGMIQDGDIIGLDPDGGVVPLLTEMQLAAELGWLSGSLDVDAAALRPDGTWLLSLNDGIETTVLGTVLDGDVLERLPGGGVGSISVWMSEAEIQGVADAALGTPGPLGDVKGVSLDPMDGSVLLCVQSPTPDDATILTTAGGGAVWGGWTEAGWGLAGEMELDGFAAVAGEWDPVPTMTASANSLATDDLLRLDVNGLAPDGSWWLFAGTQWSPSSVEPWGVPGVLSLDLADPLLATFVVLPGTTPTAVDGLGNSFVEVRVPPGLPVGVRIYVQGADLAWPRLTNPVPLEVTG